MYDLNKVSTLIINSNQSNISGSWASMKTGQFDRLECKFNGKALKLSADEVKLLGHTELDFSKPVDTRKVWV